MVPKQCIFNGRHKIIERLGTVDYGSQAKWFLENFDAVKYLEDPNKSGKTFFSRVSKKRFIIVNVIYTGLYVTSWGWTGLSSDQTGTGPYFNQDLIILLN